MPTKITPSRLDTTKDFSSLVPSVFAQANQAFVKANSAFTQANNSTDTWVRNQANNAYDKANSGATFANASFLTANAAFNAANNATDPWVRSQANNAYDKANSGASFANASFATANAAFDTANLKFNTSGGTISGDVNITGNLSVVGNNFITSSTQIVANDTLFVMGIGNYTGDVLDIGFAAHYNNGTNAHTGLIRDASVDEWYLFEGYVPEIGANNNIDINDASFSLATLNANLKSTTITLKGIDLLPYVNTAYNTANSGASFANGAFVTANAAFTAANNATDTWVRNQANTAYNTANAAFAAANTNSSNTLVGVVDTFTGDGSNSSFTLSVTPSNENLTFVAVQGVTQPKASYSLSGNILTFDFVPPNTSYIEVTTLTSTNMITTSGIKWYIANANTTMSASSGYFVDTSVGPVTMTLPTNATLGDTIRLNDLAGSFSSNNLTVARNSHKIQGIASDLLVDVDQSSFGLVYSNTTYGWKVLEL